MDLFADVAAHDAMIGIGAFDVILQFTISSTVQFAIPNQQKSSLCRESSISYTQLSVFPSRRSKIEYMYGAGLPHMRSCTNQPSCFIGVLSHRA